MLSIGGCPPGVPGLVLPGREVTWKVAFGVDAGRPFTLQVDFGFDRKGGVYEANL